MPTSAEDAYQALLARLAEVDDLSRVRAVLDWDKSTYLPEGGNNSRGEQLATLERIRHDRFSDPAVGELLDRLEPWAASLPYDSDEASLVRVVRRKYNQECCLPAAFVEERSLAASRGFHAWLAARRDNSFAAFQEPLGRIFELRRQQADLVADATVGTRPANRYDALLSLREVGMTTEQLDTLFARLKEVLVPLIQRIAEHGERLSDAIFLQHYDTGKQWDLTLEALRGIGFDFLHGRQDTSVHPFTTGFGYGDTRLTTHLYPDDFASGLTASLHEGGHGLYNQGLPARLARTPLFEGASGGVHESQSRLWENVVGRSPEWWQFFLPKAQAAFPSQLGDATVDDVVRAINVSAPSLIRIESDEVTYNLHIILRYELERAVLKGDLRVRDLPGAWSEKMQHYLGLTPPDDLHGVLQDIHWSQGMIAGFPGYTLGNVMSLQFYTAALRERPDIPQCIAGGDTSPLLQWTRTHIHDHGGKFSPPELLRRAVDDDLNPEPYLRYITDKYTALYGL